MTLPNETTPAAGQTPPPAPSQPVGSGGGASSTPPPASSPASSAAVSGAGQGGTSPLSSQPAATSGLAPQQAPGSTGQAPAAPPDPLSQALQSAGIDLSRFGGNPQQALAAINQGYQQYQQVAPYAGYIPQMVTHWSEFQKVLGQQGGAGQQPAQPAAEKPWWSEFYTPLEYDPSWERQVVQDAAGNLVPAPGAPPDAASKYMGYLQKRKQVQDQFFQNPLTFLEKPIQAIAERVARQQAQQQVGQVQQQQYVGSYVQQNSRWLHQHDAAGNPITAQQVNPRTGRLESQMVLSPWGQRFQGYIEQAQALGIGDVQAAVRYAESLTRADYASSQGAAAGLQQQGEQAKQQFVQQAAAHYAPSYGATVAPGAIPSGPPAQQPGLAPRRSYGDMLRVNMTQGGVTEQNLGI